MKVTIHVTVGDLVLRNSELEVLEVTQCLGEHSTCALEFIRDSALDLQLDALLRDPVVVTVKEEGGPILELFTGAIVDGQQSHLLNLGSRFSLRAVSSSERLEYEAMKYYPKSKLSEIAEQLGVKIDGKLRRPEKPYNLVQWGETEFAFLKRLADEHGAFLYTAGRDVEIRTEFKADRQWDLLWGDSLLEVIARARPVNNTFNGAFYSMDEKHAHRHAGIQKAPESLGGAAALWNAVGQLAKTAGGGGDPGLEPSPGRASSVKDYKSLLQAESERSLGNAVVVEGVAVKPGLMVGDVVLLMQGTNFSLPTTGKLGLTQVVHTFQDQHFRTRFVATPWATYTNPARPPAPTVGGIVVAVVIENDGDPKKLGRVKIRYPWQQSDSTGWARVATPHAGNDRGFVFLPELGDEVIVAFDEGDPERPIVIGSLWNGKDIPPPNEQGNTEKWFRTTSGNTIHLSDKDGSELIELHTPDGKCHVQLSNDGTPVITIRSAGDIAIEAEGEIRVKAAKLVQDIAGDSVKKVGGDQSFDVSGKFIAKAGLELGLSAVSAVIKGGATAEISGAATTSVAGGMVLIQPPGFVAKQVTAKPVNVTEANLGERENPKVAEPNLTADPATPRR